MSSALRELADRLIGADVICEGVDIDELATTVATVLCKATCTCPRAGEDTDPDEHEDSCGYPGVLDAIEDAEVEKAAQKRATKKGGRR